MYVCICNAVSDHEIRGAVALGARSLDDLRGMLGVATCCGRCAVATQSIGDLFGGVIGLATLAIITRRRARRARAASR